MGRLGNAMSASVSLVQRLTGFEHWASRRFESDVPTSMRNRLGSYVSARLAN